MKPLLRATASVLLRPGLWATAVRQAFVLARPGWWRRSPFLPLPDREYLRFRMVAMYGDPDHAPEGADLVQYLEWCKGFHRIKS